MVHCPTCHAELLVPPKDSETSRQSPFAPLIGDEPAPLFERSDFEDFLQNPLTDKAEASPVLAPQPPSEPLVLDRPPSPSFASTSEKVKVPSSGLFLTPAQATWLTVGIILLVTLAFGAGLLVGHYWIG